jgi:hypothetical protein
MLVMVVEVEVGVEVMYRIHRVQYAMIRTSSQYHDVEVYNLPHKMQ